MTSPSGDHGCAHPFPRAVPLSILIWTAFGLLLLGCASLGSDDKPIKPLTEKELAEAKPLMEKAEKAFSEAMVLQEKRASREKEKEAGPAQDEDLAEEKLASAIRLLEEVVDRFPGAPKLDGVLFRLGKLLRIAGEYRSAHKALFRILDRYPGSTLYSEVIEEEMEIARLLLEGERLSFLGMKIVGGSSLGAEILDEILDAAPFSRFAPEAMYRLGNYRLERKEFDEGAVLYETLVRRFPDSPFQIKAEFQAARAFFLKFTALDYDVTPLEESLSRFRAFIEVHADDPSDTARTLVGIDRGENAGASRPRFTGARAWVDQIQNLLARKNLAVGDGYRKRGYPEAAIVYYRYTRDEFPHTVWAKKAAKRINRLEEDR